MSKKKVKEPARRNNVPKGIINLLQDQDIISWLDNTLIIVKECKFHSPDSVLRCCEEKGLNITYPEVFKKIYKIKNGVDNFNKKSNEEEK
jgi:hypothetical protein